jgi:xanthine dehydrogenase accessory factor
MPSIWEEIIHLNNEGRDGILITVIDKKGQGPSVVGKKMLVDSSGAVVGSVGGGELEALAIKKAQELIIQQKHDIQIFNLSGDQPAPIGKNLNMICGGIITLFFEYLQVNPVLYIMGMGNVGRCLDNILGTLNWQIIRVNYREDIDNNKSKIKKFTDIINDGAFSQGSFIVITGYSHEEDYQVLEGIYRAGWHPRYIGLLASTNKSRQMVDKLIQNLGTDIDLSILHSPVGLDIGGKAPEEIALSIAAEIQAIRYGKAQNRHLGMKWTPEVLV